MVIHSSESHPFPELEVDERVQQLIKEFEEHFQQCVDGVGPELVERKREIYEAWAIQKIAGLQLCVEHITEVVNQHIAAETES